MAASIRRGLSLVLINVVLAFAAYNAFAEHGNDHQTKSTSGMSGTFLVRSSAGAERYMDTKILDPVVQKIGSREFLKGRLADDAGLMAGQFTYKPIDSIISLTQIQPE